MMHAAAMSSLQLVLLNVGFALLMLSAGVAVGWWLFAGVASEDCGEADREKARAALARIRELAHSVAHDVGAHSTRVQEITTDLHGYSSAEGGEIDGAVLATVAEMMKANEQLQSELASAEQKLQQQAQEIELHAADARTDPLTHLNNRRAFDTELERRHAEWKRLQVPYSVILIDVDHFKQFNDVHGHLAGDAVLRGVGRVLGEAMREMDVVCRYGGEEFAVVLPATEGEPARRGAQRAREAIERAAFEFEGTRLQVTASLGLAEVEVGDDPEALLRRADEALYAAKKAGRNQAHRHDGQGTRQLEEGAEREENAECGARSAECVSENSALRAPRSALARLPDSQGFADALRRRVAEAGRTRAPLSVMLIHVDDLSRFTQQYGPRVGDVLLDTVAQCLEVLLRDMDLLARHDEGRFAAILPNCELRGTGEIAQRLRGTIHDIAVPLKNAQVRLTVSVGFAQLADGEEVEQLVARGERALASAVAGGPDAAFLHDGQSCRRAASREPEKAKS